jgi:hypothetical protein
MKTVTQENLRVLVSVENEPCVSVYLPTRTTVFGMQDEVRFKNSLAVVERTLVRDGMPEEAAREFAAPLRNLLLTTDWRYRQKGLAAFCSSTTRVEFWLDCPVVERVLVGRRFHIKQLLPLVRPSSRFYILALSRHDVRFLEADANGYRRLEVANLPTSMEEALNLQGADRGEQVHSAMRGVLGKEAAVFHGQGGHHDTIKDEFREFCREITRAIMPTFNKCHDPLILAGVEYELAICRSIVDFPQLSNDAVLGGVDYLSDEVLFNRALPIAKKHYEQDRRRPLEKYRTMNRRILTSDELDEILEGAVLGKIETLVIDPNVVISGKFDAATNRLDLCDEMESTEDLAEFAVAQTLLHGGSVLTVDEEELPANAKMCAVFRYR